MSIMPFLIILVIVFAGLLVALRSILKRQVTDATVHLKDLSQDYLKKQDELKQRLAEADRRSQEQLAQAQAEIDRMKAQAVQEAEATGHKMLAQAREEAERIVQQAMASRDALRRELEGAMESRAIDRACELLQQTLPTPLKHQVHTQWVEELMHNGLGSLERLRVAEEVQEIHVRSAFPLTREQREGLQRQLRAKLSHPLTLKEDTDPTLVAGLTISLGNLVLEGSMASKLQEAARHAQDATRD